MSEGSTVIAHPAATVILLREGTNGCETLLVRRNTRLAFHGGAWVFPGGRLDPEDYAAAAHPSDVSAAARYAAVREAKEEAGVSIRVESLVLLSRWVTPEGLPKRFDTWFFAAPAKDEVVQVDGDEIHDHRWMRPHDALSAQRGGVIELPPPTFVTLTRLAAYQHAADTLAAVARGPFETFMPRLHIVAAGACTLYEADAGYESGDVGAPGSRHRLWMLESGWYYERSDGVAREDAPAFPRGSG